MNKRTFFRIMLDIFFNNAIMKTIASFLSWKNYNVQKYDFINFCNNNDYFDTKELKFLNNVPLYKEESHRYDNRFLFNGKCKIENMK